MPPLTIVDRLLGWAALEAFLVVVLFAFTDPWTRGNPEEMGVLVMITLVMFTLATACYFDKKLRQHDLRYKSPLS